VTVLILSGFAFFFTNFLTSHSNNLTIQIIVIITYLAIPCLTVVGEFFTRYKVILISVIFTVLLSILPIITESLELFLPANDDYTIMSYIMLSLMVLALMQIGLYQCNIIQLGLDQLIFAPSNDIIRFLYWLLFSYCLSLTIFNGFHISSFVTDFTDTKHIIYFTGEGIIFIAILFAILLLTCCKKHINIEPPPRVNPVKLIYKVTLYALRHKVPSFRSAFTYGEGPPGRFDLAKERYGGPFTTEQVEDVKSLGNILTVLLSFCGCSVVILSTNGIINQLKNSTCSNYSISETILYNYWFEYQNLILLISILIFQLILFPYYASMIPSQLKRMGIAQILVLFSSVFQLIFYLSINYFPFPVALLFIPLTVNGIGMFLSYTMFEFIIAQGPQSMQGLLLGISISMCSSLLFVSSAISIQIPSNRLWIFYLIICVIVLMSMIVYSIAALKYTPRRRNELSTVNERIIIEEYYERNLIARELADNRNENSLSLDIQSSA
jgi:peptide/histidine transporter 3/4